MQTEERQLDLPARLDRDGVEAAYDPDALAFMARGSCNGMEPEIWVTDTNHGITGLQGMVIVNGRRMRKSHQIKMARVICQRCPVASECLEHVRAYPEPEGVWAGLLPEERGEML